MYHPPTGMIVVGHPTRNSIYFLHLSAPKYGLKNISQVDYIQRLVARDSSIPQPESTAVISGIREYSFANKGLLRSLDILQNPAMPTESDDPTLFELYAMHSKGVTCIQIKQGELGWTKDNKVMAPVDAVEAGLVKISKLVAPQPSQSTESQLPAEAAPSHIRIVSRSNAKDVLQKTPSSQGEEKKGPESITPPKFVDRKEEDTPVPTAEKLEKKGRKKKAASTAVAAATERDLLNSTGNAHSPVGSSSSTLASKAVVPSTVNTALAIPNMSQDLIESQFKAMESRLESSLSQALANRFDISLGNVAKQIDKNNYDRNQDHLEKHAALLGMVSDVLNENVEKVLKGIIREQFDLAIIPIVRDTVTKSVSDQLGNKLNMHITQAVQREMQKVLPNAVSNSLQKPDLVKSISDRVVHSVAAHVDEQILKAISVDILPNINAAAGKAAQRVGSDIYRQFREEMERMEEQRRADSAKIDQLVTQTTQLATIISTMVTSHSQSQKEFLALKQDLREHDRRTSHSQSGTHSHAHTRGNSANNQSASATREVAHYGQQARSTSQEQQAIYVSNPKEDRDKMELGQLLGTIHSLMQTHNYDEAMMKWLQSAEKEEEVFKEVLVKYNPGFLSQLQPLLLLSVGATVSTVLDGDFVTQKLAWTEMVILSLHQMVHNLVSLSLVLWLLFYRELQLTATFPTQDEQVREVTPKIMTLLKTRIEHLFLRISRQAPHDPMLKILTNMANVVNRINEMVRPGAIRPRSPF
jgi:hypothetical protein